VKHFGFAPVFIFTKFTYQFRKLKSGDSRVKFIRKPAIAVLVGAGTEGAKFQSPKSFR
jgi:hypothetical protein